nr:MAG TPA: zinc-ribbon domain protein [Caudoviricetes sp.]
MEGEPGMRSVEMILEFHIEDTNLPMPHLIAAANAAFVEEAERQGLLLMSAPCPSVMHARRVVEIHAAVVEKPDWVPPTPSAPTFECPNCGTAIFAAGLPEKEEAEK